MMMDEFNNFCSDLDIDDLFPCPPLFEIFFGCEEEESHKKQRKYGLIRSLSGIHKSDLEKSCREQLKSPKDDLDSEDEIGSMEPDALVTPTKQMRVKAIA